MPSPPSAPNPAITVFPLTTASVHPSEPTPATRARRPRTAPAGKVALGHGHEVLRQRARLVAADARGAAHGLAGGEHPHQVLVPLHPPHRVGERDAHGERQALRDGHNHDGDRDDDEVDLQPRQPPRRARGMSLGCPPHSHNRWG